MNNQIERRKLPIIPHQPAPDKVPSVEHAPVMHKQSLMRRLVQVAGSTLGSRILGVERERLMMAYMEWGVVAESFITAWSVPNSLRKIFAEGALSAAFIPTLVQLVKRNEHATAHGLMSLGFLFFEGIVLLLCCAAMIWAPLVVWLMAPGFDAAAIERTVPLLRIVMPFIFFISSSALLSGPMQAVNHFFVPACSPILLNLIFIGALVGSLQYSWPVAYLCYFLVAGGALQFIWHLHTFFRLRFVFGSITPQVIAIFKPIVLKFSHCLISMSIMEVSLIVDRLFASLLGSGYITVIYLANRFMGIPLGVFVTALSTILLPHFARVSTYAPKRLSFYLHESAKFVLWVCLPVTLCMIFFSHTIFQTLFASGSNSPEKLFLAGKTLMVFVSGLIFFSMNRVLLNLFYALHNTATPALISIAATATNICLNYLFMGKWGAQGLACATVCSGIVQMILFVWYLRKHHDFVLYPKHLTVFVKRAITQLLVIMPLFLLLYWLIVQLLQKWCAAWLSAMLLHSWCLWLWVGPLAVCGGYLLYVTRARFGIRLYFLD